MKSFVKKDLQLKLREISLKKNLKKRKKLKNKKNKR
jgi:hypothetical protein